MEYVILGHVYKVFKTNGFNFAAKVICENETHLQFSNSKGVRTVVAKIAILELVDLGEPKDGA